MKLKHCVAFFIPPYFRLLELGAVTSRFQTVLHQRNAEIANLPPKQRSPSRHRGECATYEHPLSEGDHDPVRCRIAW
jgi:hypothetical protein